jgi:signal transduction histidine kinase
LARITFGCILLGWAVAVALQLTVCLVENLSDQEYFTGHYVRLETARIVKRARLEEGRVVLPRDSDLSYYWDNYGSAYAFRMLDASGRLLAASNKEILEPVSPSNGSTRRSPDFWLRKIDGNWFHVAGGARHVLGDREVWVEVATLGDPAGRHHSTVLMYEILYDVAVPLGPIFLVTTVLAIYSLRKALRPLAAAVEQAERLSPRALETRFDIDVLPQEAASFASAINRMVSRIGALVHSQEEFTARVAHTLRTSLSVVLLELGKVTDSRARRIEADVLAMGDTINRLLVLARMDTTGVVSGTKKIDLAQIAGDAVSRLEPLAEVRRCSIAIKLDKPEPFTGDPILILEAVQNLIENAVKHSPPGAKVEVTCGPGSGVMVEDSGPGLTGVDMERLFKPFHRGQTSADGVGLGLAIVKNAVTVHSGSIEVGRSLLGGARFSLRFA